MTQAQLIVMWHSLKEIERNATALDREDKLRSYNILKEVDRLKPHIQNAYNGTLE